MNTLTGGVNTPTGGVVRIGNDVVDLTDPRTRGKAEDVRFVERVFAPSEQASIAGAAEPSLDLWCLWAAKEAAYKVVSKVLGAPPPFAHRAFEASWTPGVHPRDSVIRVGSVSYETMRIFTSVERSGDVLHALGWVGELDGPNGGSPAVRIERSVARLDEPGAPWSATLTELEAKLTPDELDAVHSRESAAVRIGARGHIARALGLTEERLQIVCTPGSTGRRPPLLLVDDAPSDVDVSLSHHGSWIGWAFAGVGPT